MQYVVMSFGGISSGEYAINLSGIRHKKTGKYRRPKMTLTKEELNDEA